MLEPLDISLVGSLTHFEGRLLPQRQRTTGSSEARGPMPPSPSAPPLYAYWASNCRREIEGRNPAARLPPSRFGAPAGAAVRPLTRRLELASPLFRSGTPPTPP